MKASLPVEPLALTAALADEMAARLCRTGAGGCAYYHGAWQYLRALGLIKTLGGHPHFLVETFLKFATAGQGRRVLVAGAADYSMAAHVLHGYDLAGAEVDLTVIDICKTPLELTRWYADSIGRRVSLVHEDILGYVPDADYDAIVTSSLLGNFAPGDRPALFAAWARQLRTGGKLVFTNQVATGGPQEVAFDTGSAGVLAATAHRLAVESSDTFGFDPERVELLARLYGERRRIYPYPTLDGLQELLTHAGFSADRLDPADEQGRTGEGLSGPSLDQRRTDAMVEATRL